MNSAHYESISVAWANSMNDVRCICTCINSFECSKKPKLFSKTKA